MRVRRSLLPALIAPAVLGAAVGCSTGIAIVDNADLSETGAHYIEGRWRGGVFRYEVGSALPGDPGRPVLRPLPVSEGLASQAAHAADYVARAAHLRPPLHSVVTGVGTGVRAVGVQRFRATGREALMLPLVVRIVEGDERYARHAVRRVAHESAHLVAAFHRRRQVDEEWAASVIESCAEQAVFGTTRGYVFQDELAKPPPTFDRAQRESVFGALRAIVEVRRALEGSGTASMHSLCDSAFARLRPR
ncbi:hypothetical protein [Lysobacter sp. N42]|uniref:hypothetical protein n=1 Tax=Lysobacter sp. N42 TaxID=2545719 RepID=UPI00104420E8|nr:hypothetical protein [Lysobacter sp. N42]TCZ87748.1 hypothetical protein EYQ95_15670 [Lysobacter sp. N42]